MKFFKWLVLVVLFVMVMQGHLFSIIYSRIQGEVLDRDTDKPIAGAWVVLFVDDENGGLTYELGHTQQTDQAGKFIFHNQKKGYFAVVVLKDGYAAYGKFMNVFPSLPKEVQHKIIPPDLVFEYSSRIPEFAGGFGYYELSDLDHSFLKEGQVKHLQIKLDKEAVLQVNVSKKTLKGIVPFDDPNSEPGISVTYSNADDDTDFGLQTMYGKFSTRFLHEGDVDVEISVEGYPDKDVHVKLEKGKTVTIDHVADFTVGTVIHGVVIDKSDKKPIGGVFVSINDGNSKSVHSENNGEYYIGGITKPGTYQIRFYIGEGREIKKAVIINLNEIIEFNIEI